MYTYTGFWNTEETNLEDLSQPLKVNSCGIYRLVSRPAMSTVRPEGREDYQLMFIVAGKAWYESEEGRRSEAGAGNMILYHPGQFQKYGYSLEDKPEVYWLHFTGHEAGQMVKEVGFDEKNILFTGALAEYKELFLHIIRELQVSKACFDELTALYLKQLFVLIRRGRLEGAGSQSRMQKEIEQAVHYFNENFAQNIEIETYAQSQHMSVCWFIRNFKKYRNVTPLQYLTSIRIDRASELLTSTDYTVSEISTIVGYDNPLYFSRIFKKSTGVSPRAFRGDILQPHLEVPGLPIADYSCILEKRRK